MLRQHGYYSGLLSISQLHGFVCILKSLCLFITLQGFPLRNHLVTTDKAVYCCAPELSLRSYQLSENLSLTGHLRNDTHLLSLLPALGKSEQRPSTACVSGFHGGALRIHAFCKHQGHRLPRILRELLYSKQAKGQKAKA